MILDRPGPVYRAPFDASAIERETFTVGLLLRRQFRRLLIEEGLAFQEDRGWINSLFAVTGPSRHISFLRQLARDWQEKIG